MKKDTAEFIQHVTETQWKHAMNLKKPAGKQTAAYKEQYAYYKGMMDMLFIIATEGYTISGKSVSDYLKEAI